MKLKLEELQRTISDQNLELLPDFHQRVEVLKDLNYLDPENSTVQLKGRVACEINSADELILTELILDNMFADFEPEEIVALLSCFVCQEKNASEPNLSPQLAKGRDMIVKIEMAMAEVQKKHEVENATAPGASVLRFGLTEVVYEWARGMTFKQITELTDVQEGKKNQRMLVQLSPNGNDVLGPRMVWSNHAKKKKKNRFHCENDPPLRRDV